MNETSWDKKINVINSKFTHSSQFETHFILRKKKYNLSINSVESSIPLKKKCLKIFFISK